jgi:alkanesulfonate monooxygenase SsuD/methylene tetrahydromethanopterin reductase-like flavin-dependent oxidoreductase (luciferase family)
MFHLMPYRDLPADFDQRYNSAYIDPIWFDVADSDKVGQYYNATLDEMLFAAKSGLHGLCTNQHHQNVYGFMANPSIMGAVLAKETNGQNVAIIQLGSTLPSTTPPTRIAEEYAMLDCISGGRLVAGFPTGLPTDATISNGVIPVEQRERYREALALVIKAGRRRKSSPGTAGTISSGWSTSGRGRSSSRILRSGSPVPASPRPPSMSSARIIASAI